MGIRVSRRGEVALEDLLALRDFAKLGVTEADISRVSRVTMPRDGVATARQGHSDPNVEDEAYEELFEFEVPKVAFHVCKHKNVMSILRDGLRAGVDFGHRSNRRHVYLVSTQREAEERKREKGGDGMELIGVKLREAASKGAVVLKTSANSLLVPSPGIDVSFLFRLEAGSAAVVSRTLCGGKTKMSLPPPPAPPQWLQMKRGFEQQFQAICRRTPPALLPPSSVAAVAGGQVPTMMRTQPPVVAEGTHSKANSNIAQSLAVAKASSLIEQPPSTDTELPKQRMGTSDLVVADSARTPLLQRLDTEAFNRTYNPRRTNTRQLSPGPRPVPSNYATDFDPTLFLQHGHLEDVTQLELGQKRFRDFQTTMEKIRIDTFKASLVYMAT